MNNNIFHCTPLHDNSGYTWTIVSRLGSILTEIESLYGERDKSFTILGVEIADIEQPQTWFPGNNKNVIIQITPTCFYSLGQAIFQVAHEAIHCLNPKTHGHSSWLEEGLATWFSSYYTKKNGYNIYPSHEKYMQSLLYVQKLLSYDNHVIKNIRMNYEQDLSKISSATLLKACPQLDEGLAINLAKKFED